MLTLDQIRQAGESHVERILADSDGEARRMLADALRKYGRVQDIPENVWQEIRDHYADNDRLAAAILLLFVAADDWTVGQIAQQGVSVRSQVPMANYAIRAARQTQGLAGTVDTLRDRLARKIEDSRLTGPGKVGDLSDQGIDQELDGIFTDQRRKTIATDATTKGISGGQLGARDRAAGDGASAVVDRPYTIALIWKTERDWLVCPRCGPLEGQPEEVWSLVFPEGPGPGSHPNCRCELLPEIVWLNEDVSESFRESEEPSGEHWITLDNGAHVKIDDEGKITAGPAGLKGTDLDVKKTKGVRKKLDKLQGKADKKAGEKKPDVGISAKLKPSEGAGKKIAPAYDKYLSSLDGTPEAKAIKDYTGAGYERINKTLRKGGEPTAKILAMDKAIANAPVLKQDIVVARGVQTDSFLSTLKVGDVFGDKGFMSTEVGETMAVSFATLPTKNSSPALLHIKVPKGSKGLFYTPGMQDEFILPRNSKLKITGMGTKTVVGTKKQVRFIQAELVAA